MHKKEKIKILQFITGIDVGGAEKLLLETMRNIDSKYFECSVCYLKGNGALRTDFEKINVKVIPLNLYSKTLIGKIYQFYTLLKEYKYDILHTHLIHATLIGRIIGKIAGIKIIITTEHNTSNYQSKYFLISLLYKLSIRCTNHIIAISEAVKKEIVNKIKINPDKITVIYDGINLDYFNKSKNINIIKKNLNIENVSPIIAIVSRLDKRKGITYLLNAIQILKNRYPNIALLVVGDGKEKENLITQTKELQIQSNIKYLGTQNDVRPILSIADIFVLPSLHEGLSIAIIEAMAMNLPIVATNVGGIPEVIENNYNGFLVEPHKSLELSDAIEKIILNKKTATKFSKNGRIIVEQKFNIITTTKQLENLYKSVLRKNKI